MKRISFIFLSILIAFPCLGQNIEDLYIECRLPIEPKTDDISNPISGMGDTMYREYIPYQYQQSIPVHVNLIFFQKDNGSGNFQQDDEEHQRFWDKVTQDINYRYANITNSSIDSCFAWIDPVISNSHIKFIFNQIYIKDSRYWDWSASGTSPETHDSKLKEVMNWINSDSDIPKGINVCFTENSDLYQFYLECILEGTQTPSKSNRYAYTTSIDGMPWIHMPDTYCKYLWMKHIVPLQWETPVTWEDDVWYWEANTVDVLLSHELGHALDLNHACNHYGKNYCRDALMSPTGETGFSHRYIPPTEIGKMHRHLSLSRVRETIDPDLPIAGQLDLYKGTTWASLFRSYTNINITSSGRITANAGIQMPQKSHIDVEGQLYIRNGDVECVMEDGTWNGIRVKSGGMLWLENTAISDYDIVLEPGSTLVLKGNVTVDNNHKIVIGSGCYVCAASDLSILGSAKPFVRDGSLYSGIRPGTSLLHNSPCSSTGWNRFIAASSTLSDVLYVQNQQISTDQTFVAKEIVVGSNVTSSQTSGQVTIKNGAHVNFISVDGTRFDKGFRCENGASFKVMKIEE